MSDPNSCSIGRIRFPIFSRVGFLSVMVYGFRILVLFLGGVGSGSIFSGRIWISSYSGRVRICIFLRGRVQSISVHIMPSYNAQFSLIKEYN